MGDNMKAGSGIELDLIDLPDLPELDDEESSAETEAASAQKRVQSLSQDGYDHVRLSNTLEELDRKMKSGQFLHTFTAQIGEVNRIVKMQYASTTDIASVILQDVALSVKVLSIVNSSYYGHFGEKGIGTIPEAVFILGTDEVQQAATTILLFEFMRDIAKSDMLKEKSLASLMRGMMAKQIAEEANYRDPEEFQIAAMLYDIGEQIVLFCEPEAYHQICLSSEQNGIDRDGVAKKILGASFSQIGQEIISGWGFPRGVVDSIRPFEEFGMNPQKMTIQILKRIVASLTNELCSIDWRTNEILRKQKLQGIVQRYGHLLDLELFGTYEIMKSAIKKVENHARILKVSLKESRFDRRQKESVTADKIGISQKGGKFPKAAISSEDKVTWVESQIDKIENKMIASFKLSEILQLIVNTIYQGFFFSRISICIMNKANGMMAVRLVLGEESERFGREFGFVVSDSDDLFNKSLSTGLDIVVEDLEGRRMLNSRIPDWYVKGGFASSFAIYPVVVEQKKVGLIYVDWDSSQTHLFSDQVKQFMKRLKNLTVTAIKKSRT